MYYPGLDARPQHDLAATQMGGFELDGTLETAETLVSGTEVLTLAESLGGVESIIEQPATTAHASIPREVRQEAGIADGLVRVSVGLEDVADLRADLDRALTAAVRS